MSYSPWILTFSFDSGRSLGPYILVFRDPKHRFLRHNSSNTTTFVAFAIKSLKYLPGEGGEE